MGVISILIRDVWYFGQFRHICVDLALVACWAAWLTSQNLGRHVLGVNLELSTFQSPPSTEQPRRGTQTPTCNQVRNLSNSGFIGANIGPPAWRDEIGTLEPHAPNPYLLGNPQLTPDLHNMQTPEVRQVRDRLFFKRHAPDSGVPLHHSLGTPIRFVGCPSTLLHFPTN